MSVELNSDNRHNINRLSEYNGKTASTIVNEVLEYWWITEGELALERNIKKKRAENNGHVLPFVQKPAS